MRRVKMDDPPSGLNCAESQILRREGLVRKRPWNKATPRASVWCEAIDALSYHADVMMLGWLKLGDRA
jgi:hypothetical protein